MKVFYLVILAAVALIMAACDPGSDDGSKAQCDDGSGRYYQGVDGVCYKNDAMNPFIQKGSPADVVAGVTNP